MTHLAKRAEDQLLNFFNFLAPLLKDPSFREEQEWRIVLRSDGVTTIPTPSYRIRSNAIVPYYSMGLANGITPIDVHSITVGPCHHKSLEVEAVLGYAKQHRVFSRAVVEPSKIPYQQL
jgi:hypothetical protein